MMTKKLQLVLIFAAGALCGILIVIGAITLYGRQSWHVGGETLLPLLFALLVYFGWSVGTESDQYRQKYERAKSYKQGYRDGIRRASAVITMPDTYKEVLVKHGMKY